MIGILKKQHKDCSMFDLPQEIMSIIPIYGGSIDKVIKNKHVKIYASFGNEKGIFTISASPSDYRAHENMKSKVRILAKKGGVYKKLDKK